MTIILMKKLLRVLTIILSFSMVLTACSNQPKDKVEKHKNNLTYSNLVDLSSQNEIKKDMESAGVLPENIDFFFQSVNNFNNTINCKGLVKEGFTTIDNLKPKYDETEIEEMWNAKNPLFIGHNCRITSFALMKNLISIGKIDTRNSNNLFMDIDALTNSPTKVFNELEQKQFETLFSYVPTDNTKDITVHANKVKNAWKDRDIEFSKDGKASLISVFFHAYEDNYLFIGHAGVLLPTEDGKLLFIEKLSFQQPYQAIKFDNRDELKDYLMNSYDVEYNQPSAKPFVMENGELLESKAH